MVSVPSDAGLIPRDELVESLLLLEVSIDVLEKKLSERKKERDEINAELAVLMAKERTQNFTLDSGETFYLRRDIFCNKLKEASTEDVLAALRLAGDGFEETIETSFVAAKVKALVRDRDKRLRETRPEAEASESLPEVLRGSFKVFEKVQVAIRGRKKGEEA